MSESVLLRTLTRKSILGFGKYTGMRVQQVIDLGRNAYLRWIYYTFEGITFTEDILKEITILKKRRISKPGNAPEMNSKITEENIKFLSFRTKNHVNKVLKIRAKSKLRRTYNSVNFSKSQLQATNHGKML